MEDNSSISNFKRIVTAIIFAILVAIAVYYTVIAIADLYSSVANKNAVNEKSDMRFADFYSLPKNSLDIAFVGSSHAYCSFDPEIFDRELGTSSFQLGMPLQHPDATYYTVKELFNYQSPKLLVVEVYWDMLDDAVEMKQALTLFNSLKNDELEKQYVDEVFNFSEKIKYNLDVINYQGDYFAYMTNEIKKDMQKNMHVVNQEEQQEGEEYYRSKGYVYCDFSMPPSKSGRTNQYNGFNGRKYEINNTQKSYVKKIVDLCNERGTKVVFVTTPVANVSVNKLDGYEFVNKQVSDVAKELSVPYIDYNMKDTRNGMFYEYYFRDDAHLNDLGVQVLDEHFINWLRSISIM